MNSDAKGDRNYTQIVDINYQGISPIQSSLP
mgnify:CR=1 FL=1